LLAVNFWAVFGLSGLRRFWRQRLALVCADVLAPTRIARMLGFRRVEFLAEEAE
jgi:hypothetical protein